MAFEDFSQNTEEHYYDGEPHSFNRAWMGFALSLVFPVLTMLLVFYLSDLFKRFDTIEALWNFIVTDETGNMNNIMVMALMPNLFLFFYIYKSERWKLSRGFISGTLLFLALFFMRSVL